MSNRRHRTDPPRESASPELGQSRPPPVPPPPKMLVTLIQKNKRVLEYFQSLNENLDADVQTWKHRARRYQKLYEEQLAENEALKRAAVAEPKDDNTNQCPVGKRKRRESDSTQSNHPGNENEIVAKGKSAKASNQKPAPTPIHNEEIPNDGPPATILVGDSLAELPDSSDDESIGKYRSKANRAKVQSISSKDLSTNRKPSSGGKTVEDDMFDFDDDNDDDGDDSDGGDAVETYARNSPTKQSEQPRKNGKGKTAGKRPMTQARKLTENEDRKPAAKNTPKQAKNLKKDDCGIRSAQISPKKSNQAQKEETRKFLMDPSLARGDELALEGAAGSESLTPFWKIQQQFILSELLDAYRCLEHVGVELVERSEVEEKKSEPVPTVAGERDKEKAEDDEDDEAVGLSFLPDEADTTALKRQLADDSEEEAPTQTKAIFRRRSDDDVICDVLQSIRTLTRVQIQFNGVPKEYYPFRIPPKWIPCGDQLSCEGQDKCDHPAYVAKKCLFRALSLMGTYCGAGCLHIASNPARTSSDPWESLFDDKQTDHCNQAIMIGMRDRKEMVEQLMQSIYGEISIEWAVADRGSWMDNEHLIYDPISEADTESEPGSGDDCHAQGEKIAETAGDKMMAAMGTKGQSRLSTMAERRLIAQLTVNLYLFQKNSQQAFMLACNYVLSSVPSIECDDYPRYPPALSLVVLEAMLSADGDLIDVGASDDKIPIDGHINGSSQFYFGQIINILKGDGPAPQLSKPNRTLADCIRRAISLSVHSTALIWRQRLESNEQRIADSARVEWASYLRLLESQGSWLGGNALPAFAAVDGNASHDFAALHAKHKEASVQLIKDTLLGLNERGFEQAGSRESSTGAFGLALAFVLNGDFTRPRATLESAVQEASSKSIASILNLSSLRFVSLACCKAFRESEIRQRDRYHKSIGALEKIPEGDHGATFGNASMVCVKTLLDLLKFAIDRSWPKETLQKLSGTLLRCCSLVSNGEMAYEVLELVQSYDGLADQGKAIEIQHSGSSLPMNSLEYMAQMPSVRVINLHRRRDRMNLMLSQAMEAGILLLKAIAVLGNYGGLDNHGEGDPIKTGGNGEKLLFGGYAIDGKMALDEISAQIFEDESSASHRQRLLEKKLVASHWRPHDLKAFDSNANDDENVLVRVSKSERACALSHIASWSGVLRSLSMVDQESSPRFRGSVHRLALSSGFALGEALDPQNWRMPPTAVCVVLEDDAILVDRFADRLYEILEELPRDFHFCSLGYSRPRTAPLVKFSKHLGIPTNLFYLTGYILSLEGARYLLDSLPVCGPVDSWVGFKMMANWDNRFGAIVGLGNQSKPNAEAPCRKDIATILRFRAYAAMVPLCYQKVGGGANASTAGVSVQNWRLRDSDIEYSGSTNYTG